MGDRPYTILPATTPTALLFVCDHAGNALPEGAGTLGLEPARLHEHIAYDIGAQEATLALAEAYGAGAVLARYSRLFIDLNRGADDPTLVMRLSDGRIIPANARIDDAEIARGDGPHAQSPNGRKAAMVCRGQPKGQQQLVWPGPGWRRL